MRKMSIINNFISDDIVKANIELSLLFTMIIVGISISTFALAQYHKLRRDDLSDKLRSSYYINLSRQVSLYGGIGYLLSFFLLISSIDVVDGARDKQELKIFLFNLSYIISVMSAYTIVFFLFWYLVIIKYVHGFAINWQKTRSSKINKMLLYILEMQKEEIEKG